jgi:hypothetical protein
MTKLLALVLAFSLSGCILVTDEPYDDHHHYVPGPSYPPPEPEPAVYHLDCGWLATFNCWDQAVAEAEACAPDTYNPSYSGVFGDFGHSCFFPDGSAVFFEERVTYPLAPDHLWSFSMEDPAGNTCGWVAESDTTLSIGTASGIVDLVVDSSGVSVICQDGTQWYNADPFALNRCAGSELDLPGNWTESFVGGASFGLTGGTVPSLWSCMW